MNKGAARATIGGMLEYLELLLLSLRLQGGRFYWAIPLLPLAWLAFHGFRLAMGWEEGFDPVDAQNFLIGIPLVVLAVGLGLQIIAGEIEDRTLEACYTVPGGAVRIWLAKLAALIGLLTVAEALLAAATALFFTGFPLSALYGAWQGAIFYLLLATLFGALLGNRLSAGLFTGAILFFFNAIFAGFGENPTRYSPHFNPLALADSTMDATEILAWTIQNRIGTALAAAALLALTVTRAERREKLLSEGA